ncbi:hypothetical protein BST65_01850 [Bradyrhizobium canariense]|nr:hypothetical protein BST65_01850 [Bradyrhizobium canariense]OSI39313.1 hypothetical protein BST66_01615 [Bradyrhizobium canariense]OSI55614.1 hypothetical protein BSZ20_01640 [Bradyrhizobium canariense]OSI57715.1 hypothetical protein BST67_01515 [Bradyrhizobium canariense]OSI60512.1 hypothetical protein BSZ15_01925 [Bradyrhizobium canariense]
MTSQSRRASDPQSDEPARRLLTRAVKRSRPKPPVPPVPFGTETDPNREFSRDEPEAVWFFVFLPIFMLLYAIVEKMHVR